MNAHDARSAATLLKATARSGFLYLGARCWRSCWRGAAFSTSQRGAQGRSSLSAMPRACFFACARGALTPPVVALRARAVRRGAWRLGRCVSGTATKRFPSLHARNRGLWIPDSSTAPDSVRRSSVRYVTHLQKASSDIRLKNALMQAASIPPVFSQEAAENARGSPRSVHSPPPFRAGFEQEAGARPRHVISRA